MHFRSSIVLGFLLAAVAVAPVVASPQASQPAPTPGAATIEQEFLSGMIPHHRGAVMMAEMAVMKATQPELRELAQKIIDDQRREIGLMSMYLKEWYGMDPPEGMMMPMESMSQMMPMPHGTMPDMMARMRALEAKSGPGFDIEFMSAMTDHHAMAIMMAAPVLVNAEHPELYPLALQIVAAQAEEIKQFLEWLNAWYGVERPL